MTTYVAYTIDTPLPEVVELYQNKLGLKPSVILIPTRLDAFDKPQDVTVLKTPQVSYIMATHEYSGEFRTEKAKPQ